MKGLISFWTLDAEITNNGEHFCEVVLATEQDRAAELSCRACGAGAWALGLDSRWGSSASLRFSPPTSNESFTGNNRSSHTESRDSLQIEECGN